LILWINEFKCFASVHRIILIWWYFICWVWLLWNGHLFSNNLLDYVDPMWWLFILKRLRVITVYFQTTSNDDHLFSNDFALLW